MTPDPTAGTRTVVHLLRHGKVHNPSGVLYGRLPGYHLAASGRAMADRIAEHLSGNDITSITASSLIRAQETAAPLAALKGLEVLTDDRIIEAGNFFEGKKVAVGDGVLREPKYWSQLRNPFTPSWGEPYLQIAHRMMAGIGAALERSAGHEAVLVSHQLPIVTVRRYLEGRRLWHNPANRQCAVASLTSLTFEDGVFVGLRYSEPAADIQPVDDDGSTGPEAGA